LRNNRPHGDDEQWAINIGRSSPSFALPHFLDDTIYQHAWLREVAKSAIEHAILQQQIKKSEP